MEEHKVPISSAKATSSHQIGFHVSDRRRVSAGRYFTEFLSTSPTRLQTIRKKPKNDFVAATHVFALIGFVLVVLPSLPSLPLLIGSTSSTTHHLFAVGYLFQFAVTTRGRGSHSNISSQPRQQRFRPFWNLSHYWTTIPTKYHPRGTKINQPTTSGDTTTVALLDAPSSRIILPATVTTTTHALMSSLWHVVVESFGNLNNATSIAFDRSSSNNSNSDSAVEKSKHAVLSLASKNNNNIIMTIPMASATSSAAISTPLLNSWVQLCGQIAPTAAVVVCASPFPTIRQIIQEKSVGNLPLLPYSSLIISCFVWTTYGLLKGEPKIWSSNGVGLVLGLYYFYQFTRYSPAASPTLPGSVRQHVMFCATVIAAVLSLALGSGLPSTTSRKYIGYIAVTFSVALFASPLAAIKTVLSTRSARSIPLPFTVASVINCFLWSITGLLDMNDMNVYVPNIMGLTFGLIQVALKIIYGNAKEKSVDLPM